MVTRSDFSQGWDTIYIPSTHIEHVLFYVALAINLVNIPLAAYAIWYRSYLPIKCKHVWIVSSIGVSTTIFNVSMNVTTGLIGYNNALLWSCRLWSSWLLNPVGMGLALSLINMRLIIYYRVFITRRTFSYKKFTFLKFCKKYWPLFVLWFPSLVTAIVVQILPPRLSVRSVYDKGVPTCDFYYPYLYWCFGYFALLIFISWGLYFRMIRIAKAFNEFKLAIWSIIIFTVMLVANITMAMVGGTIYAWGRIASAFINTAMLNSYFLLILAPPVFGHIFHREKTLRKFLDALHSDGLVAQEARLGNAHKQLYGMDEGTDTYISASGTGPNKSSASQVPPENTATYFTYNNTFSQQQDKATGVQFSRVEDDYMFESDHELAYAMPSPFNAPQPMDYDHNTRIL